MPSFLHLLHYIFTFITPYNGVKSAMEDPAQVESVIKKFSAQRAICLMIVRTTYTDAQSVADIIPPQFCALFTKNAHQGRSNWIALILGAILFTGRISLVYDGLNEEQFKMQMRIIGPEIYTIINMLPAIILQSMLLYEIFTMSSSIALAVVIAFSCFTLGFASFVAVGVMGNKESELMPLTAVTTNMAQHAAV
ncbi:hypothetical protein BDQ17DRAFT_1506846 [Cyathus striatus]|nr:hypothetical protein BDQ17DRAFT_1506846 [Cyathus striatus]